jgi:hypothetical protein
VRGKKDRLAMSKGTMVENNHGDYGEGMGAVAWIIVACLLVVVLVLVRMILRAS